MGNGEVVSGIAVGTVVELGPQWGHVSDTAAAHYCAEHCRTVELR